jgi:hypothetical protein
MKCFVQIGSCHLEGYIYVESWLLSRESSAATIKTIAPTTFLGFNIPEEKLLEVHDPICRVVGFDHPVLANKVFFDIPFKDGKFVGENGDLHVLKPIEKYQRIEAINEKESQIIKGLEITKHSHLSGAVGNIHHVQWYTYQNLACYEAKSFEDAYKAFAKELATKRPC